MTREEFKTWATNVIHYVEESTPELKAFISQIEPHDKATAAILSQQIKLNEALAKRLQEYLKDRT